MSNAQGLDVSNWQGDFDWRGHPSIDFAGVKVCEHGAQDVDFADNWNDMWDTFGGKVVRIGYGYLHPGEAMAPQVDALVQIVRDHGLKPGDHFGADIEEMDGCSVPEVVAFARAASERVNKQALDHRCFGYTYLDFPAPWGLWPLWVADTGVANPGVPAPWKRWWIWQWRQNPLDLDQFNGDRDALLNFCRMPAERR